MNEKVTIAIDQKHDKILEKLCKIHKCTKKSFVCSSIIFFDKNNISPIDESPEQINKLHKKLDNVIAFIRKQEQDILRPAVEVIKSNETQIQLALDSLLTKQDLKQINDNIRSNIENNRQTYTLLSQTRQAQEEAFKSLARLIDAKEKTGVFMDIGKAYSQS